MRILALLAFRHDRLMHVPGNTGFIMKGHSSAHFLLQSPNTFGSVRRHEFGLICISSESCLWSNVGFAQLLGLLPYVPFYRLRKPKENYCDCALVISDEHLSRESRKLTIMIQRETVEPLEDSPESLGFLRINEGPFPGHLHTRPYPDAREGTRAT